MENLKIHFYADVLFMFSSMTLFYVLFIIYCIHASKSWIKINAKLSAIELMSRSFGTSQNLKIPKEHETVIKSIGYHYQFGNKTYIGNSILIGGLRPLVGNETNYVLKRIGECKVGSQFEIYVNPSFPKQSAITSATTMAHIVMSTFLLLLLLFTGTLIGVWLYELRLTGRELILEFGSLALVGLVIISAILYSRAAQEI